MIDWQALSTLFGRLDHATVTHLTKSSHTKVYDDEWPDREWEDRYSVRGFGYDIVYKAGPHDWGLPGANKRHGILDRQLMRHDYCMRKKIYLHGDEIPPSTLAVLPELAEFTELYTEFKPRVAEHESQFHNQSDIWHYVYQLMLIEYSNNSVPAGEEDRYWTWNFEKFGLPHSDESLGGLHLGENLPGFYIDDCMGRTFYNPSTDDTLWFWGQESVDSGYEPTVHGVEYLNNSNGENRYSVIFNLKAKRK